QYLYHADLTSEGIILTDISESRWQDNKATLPIQNVVLGKALTPRLLSQQLAELRAYSKKNNCLFLTRIVDKTLSHEKEWYKSMKQAVEGITYIFEQKKMQ